MSFTDTKRSEIKKYLLRKIDEDDSDLVTKTADAFGTSATSIKRYLVSEAKSGHIKPDNSKECGFSLNFEKKAFSYSLAESRISEDRIFFHDLSDIIPANDNGMRIWSYSLCEIINNAIEHSKGSDIRIIVETCFLYSRITISDNGIGIFKNIINHLSQYGYQNPTYDDAITELFKGKFTSSPMHHSGEGIFFTRHLLDRFSIVSDGCMLKIGYAGDPAVIRSHLIAYAMKISKKGTLVNMQLENNTSKNIKSIMDQYATAEEGFIRTELPVLEACQGNEPVARSQARRICMRLDSFKEAILDFDNVTFMGQGFADEIFRVFHNSHPEVIITPVNMSADVKKMYLYTINNKVTPVYTSAKS